MTDEIMKQISEAEMAFYREVKNKLDIDINPGSSQSSSAPNGWKNFKFKIPDQMEELNGTKYYCSETKLLHFTSLEALLSIINDSSIRMYNLWNSSDEQEYTHAAKIFDRIYEIIGQKGETRTRIAKTYSFISSFTRSENYLSPYHWTNYGNNNKGVAIEFEIKPEYKAWYKFILSKTFYNKLEDFDALFNTWHDFQTQIAIPNNSTFDIDLNWLLSLYKDKSFSDEDETRLYLYADGYHATFPKHFAKYTYSESKTESIISDIKYFKLPLCDDSWSFMNPLYHEDESEFWERIPRIRISKIYIGPNTPIKDLDQLRYEMKSSLKEKTGKNLEINDIQKVNL
jgi:hypothetical protein